MALTDAGKALIDTLLPVHVETERKILTVLTDGEQRTLNALLAKLLSGLG